jgi:hypothetical protein
MGQGPQGRTDARPPGRQPLQASLGRLAVSLPGSPAGSPTGCSNLTEPRARTGRTKGRRASDPAAGSRRCRTMKAGRPSRSRLPGLGEGRWVRPLVGRRATRFGARELVIRELRPRQHQHVAVPGCRLEGQPANDEVAFVFPCRYAGEASRATLSSPISVLSRALSPRPRITVPWIETVMVSLLYADRGETRHPGGIRARRRGLI